MPYCRECGTQVADFARFCPNCGTPQGAALPGQPPVQASAPRNVGVLIVLGCGYTLIGWLGFLFLGGFVIGIMNAGNPDVEMLGEQFGRAAGLPSLLIVGALVGALTASGVLPGTRKK